MSDRHSWNKLAVINRISGKQLPPFTCKVNRFLRAVICVLKTNKSWTLWWKLAISLFNTYRRCCCVELLCGIKFGKTSTMSQEKHTKNSSTSSIKLNYSMASRSQQVKVSNIIKQHTTHIYDINCVAAADEKFIVILCVCLFILYFRSVITTAAPLFSLWL